MTGNRQTTIRIAKTKWRQMGGFKNSELYRSQRGKSWAYFWAPHR